MISILPLSIAYVLKFDNKVFNIPESFTSLKLARKFMNCPKMLMICRLNYSRNLRL